MTKKEITCKNCASSVPDKAAFMHVCGKVWYPFSDSKNRCPNCNKLEETIPCPFCGCPNNYKSWLSHAAILKQKAIEREIELKNRKGFSWLEKIIDEYLDKMELDGHMKTPSNIPLEMLVEESTPSDWSKWKAIKSTLNDEKLDAFEKRFNIILPKSYRHYLKYKHFFSLYLDNKTISLPHHLPQENLKNIIGQDMEFMGFIKKGLLYFADSESLVFLCFDTNQIDENGECPILSFEHDEFYSSEQLEEKEGDFIFSSFEDLLLSKNVVYY